MTALPRSSVSRSLSTTAARSVPTGEGVRDRIVRLHAELSRCDSLAPAPDVDELFRELVRLCVHADESVAVPVLADERVRELVPDLLRLCSEGEALLELSWSRRLLDADDPWAELAQFPYLDNYRQLTRLELHALAGVGAHLSERSRVCFLGGGPLPISALLMHRELGVRVDVVDVEPEAVRQSRRVLRRLVPGPGLDVVRADAACGGDMARVLPGCEVVILAALVGRTREEKRAVLGAVGAALDAGACLVVRSAHGLRSLLYPVVDLADVMDTAGCLPAVLVHPFGEVVNSVLVARRR